MVVNYVKIKKNNQGKHFTEFTRIQIRSLFHWFLFFVLFFFSSFMEVAN